MRCTTNGAVLLHGKTKELCFYVLNGKQFARKLPCRRSSPLSASEVAVRRVFAIRVRIVEHIMRDEDLLLHYKSAFRRQNKCKTLRGFVMHKVSELYPSDEFLHYGEDC